MLHSLLCTSKTKWVLSTHKLVYSHTFVIRQATSLCVLFSVRKSSWGRWASLTSRTWIPTSDLKHVSKALLMPCTKVKKLQQSISAYLLNAAFYCSTLHPHPQSCVSKHTAQYYSNANTTCSYKPRSLRTTETCPTRQHTISPHSTAANNTSMYHTARLCATILWRCHKRCSTLHRTVFFLRNTGGC